jgi:hypothetical protein
VHNAVTELTASARAVVARVLIMAVWPSGYDPSANWWQMNWRGGVPTAKLLPPPTVIWT